MSRKKIYTSLVKGHEGLCKPTWLDTNQVSIRVTTRVTGTFKNVKRHWLWGWIKYGEEFGGYISSKGDVRTTEGIYNTNQFV